jgi:hypothetical protein
MNKSLKATLPAVLAVAATLASAYSYAQGNNPTGLPNALNVNVTNTPLPVTGTVSGAVTITNQPNVFVTNTPANPVPVVSVASARTPFQARASCFGQPGISGIAQCDVTFDAVPAGKRVIVEHVTGEMRLTPGAKLVQMQGTGGWFAPKFVGLVPGPFARDHWALNEKVLDFLDAGRAPGHQALVTGGEINMNVTIAGYLVNQ